MGKLQITQIILRILLLIINGIIIFYTYNKEFIANTIGFSFILSFQIFLFIDYLKKLFSDIEKSIDCLLYNDYSNTISKEKRKNSLHNKTALLLEKHRKLSLQASSETLIFNNIIESLTIGVLILRKDAKDNIQVFQINKAFTDFLKIPRFYNWQLLKERVGNLSQFISEWKHLKHTITLKINNKEENFFLKSSATKTNEYQYLIITLETIQQLINKKEKEAWYKLMNVMSHEIINTITPISSLAENLEGLIQDEADDETLEELSTGLKIIKKRSKHLTSFVDTYRKLAELPLPNKEKLNLVPLVENTISLFDKEFKQNKIQIELFTIVNNEVLADKEQIEQVIINLLSNCIYALKGILKPKITITIETTKENRTHLKINDNGVGISNEIKDNIFVPYFTTRKDGSGIGLTLSKSIIEAHNGIIQFKSSLNSTTFTLTFIN
ncbi:HAMP domain-containing sensor histidine kinase [uncultured Tenacibaculum sp.]|uniref:sensor histidine kinase n=1 Tax=uncultured Tenacibaculum sp. TaxID=174713 RepID=UPI002626EFEE|nr:HAMP domain-containing sensor histidine kinase [uncultured Tenacibaculum sp.]